MNLVLEETIEEVSATEKRDLGSVVNLSFAYLAGLRTTQLTIYVLKVIRGNSVVLLEALEKI